MAHSPEIHLTRFPEFGLLVDLPAEEESGEEWDVKIGRNEIGSLPLTWEEDSEAGGEDEECEPSAEESNEKRLVKETEETDVRPQ